MKPKTKSAATKAELRLALENLLADVTGGEISGRNPWSVDSVKAASLALTGDKFGFSSSVIRRV